jgi:hypothetical protein
LADENGNPQRHCRGVRGNLMKHSVHYEFLKGRSPAGIFQSNQLPYNRFGRSNCCNFLLCIGFCHCRIPFLLFNVNMHNLARKGPAPIQPDRRYHRKHGNKGRIQGFLLCSLCKQMTHHLLRPQIFRWANAIGKYRTSGGL